MHDLLDTDRLAAFSDGVFAVAIPLLAVALNVVGRSRPAWRHAWQNTGRRTDRAHAADG